ncbi:MAG TPA: phosphatidylglycerophosphatase A [Candidatus Acidoferrum sp.]|nr:phosphatidylglycerophosphatase A [Candidatus Acidoferrum sp.]
MAPSTESPAIAATRPQKPRLAMLIATALGIGYIPKAPGTFGSLAGIVIAILTHPVSLLTIFGSLFFSGGLGIDVPKAQGHELPWLILVPPLAAFFIVGALGVWSSTRASEYSGAKDPQMVVVDEVSGMHLTLVLGIMPFWLPTHFAAGDNAYVFALYSAFSLLNWKYLLLGFVLFRAFDIWKPYPIRRLEKLPRGWGIMADDWMAGIYAAILLKVALHFGLLGRI